MTDTDTPAPQAESHTAVTKRILAELARRWPTLFDPDKPVPLAIGIFEELLEAMPGTTPEQLRRILGPWCHRPLYLRALVAGAERHGLAGVRGAVAEERAAEAARELTAARIRLYTKIKAKRLAVKAKEAEDKRKAAEARARKEAAEAEKARAAAAKKAPPARPAWQKPGPASKPATPAAGPTIVVKKRRAGQPTA